MISRITIIRVRRMLSAIEIEKFGRVKWKLKELQMLLFGPMIWKVSSMIPIATFMGSAQGVAVAL